MVVMMMMMMLGISRFPEQPAAAVSDAGGEVSQCELNTRTRGTSTGRAGPTDAESARSRRRQRSSDEPAHGDRVVQGTHRVPGEEVYVISSQYHHHHHLFAHNSILIWAGTTRLNSTDNSPRETRNTNYHCSTR